MKSIPTAAMMWLLTSLPAMACTVSATGLSFGAIDPLSGAARDATATITVTCPSPTSFSVSLSPGFGSFGRRTMMSGSQALQYNLFLDPSMTLIWGDGTSGTNTWSGTADSSSSSHAMYGRVPYQPTAPPGTYGDSITVTVTY